MTERDKINAIKEQFNKLDSSLADLHLGLMKLKISTLATQKLIKEGF